MNKITFVALLLALWFTSCKQKPQTVAAATQGKAYYTCSMHPQIHEDHPGNCPICGMKLIRVELTGYNGAATDKIKLTPTQIELAGIRTDTVRAENTGSEKTLTGTVTANENNAEEVSARIAGRIQRLFVRTTGEKISVGQPVYSIYSEDLQEAEKEYLLARQQQKMLHNPDVDYRQLITAAENKLQLWGLSPTQIKGLAMSGKVSATTTVLSKVNGTVSEIAVHEGDYVTEGMTILKTQGLNSLWVEAQVYAGEAAGYKEGAPVDVSFPDLGEQLIKGRVVFINPELSTASNVNLTRIAISNPGGNIRPGMLAYVTIANGNNRALAVPASAVLMDGHGSRVWVRNPDGSFSPKTITVRSGNQTYVPVISGLNAGDVVVSNGAYLLNSEAMFKNGGDDGMGNMKM
jgi:Cu(I)/Ag(I) efflux system membrane fusion protein